MKQSTKNLVKTITRKYAYNYDEQEEMISLCNYRIAILLHKNKWQTFNNNYKVRILINECLNFITVKRRNKTIPLSAISAAPNNQYEELKSKVETEDLIQWLKSKISPSEVKLIDSLLEDKNNQEIAAEQNISYNYSYRLIEDCQKRWAKILNDC